MTSDLDLMIEHLQSDDLLALFLKGQIWIESALEEALRRKVKRPDLLPKDMMFGRKLLWAQIVGAVDPLYVPFITRLSRIRNKLAHQPRFTVDEQQIDELVALLAGDVAEIYAELAEGAGRPMSYPERLSTALLVVAMRMRLLNDRGLFAREWLARSPEMREQIAQWMSPEGTAAFLGLKEQPPAEVVNGIVEALFGPVSDWQAEADDESNVRPERRGRGRRRRRHAGRGGSHPEGGQGVGGGSGAAVDSDADGGGASGLPSAPGDLDTPGGADGL